MKENKRLEPLNDLLVFLIPFIVIFGICLIINGDKSPGGGFQGGAIFTGIFITSFLVDESREFNLNTLKLVEKFAFISLTLIILSFLFVRFTDLSYEVKKVYLLITNLLIGVKVCAGLTLVFLRFSRIEREDE